MKKTMLFALMMTLLIGVIFAQNNPPPFESSIAEGSNVFIIDSNEVPGRIAHHVKLINASQRVGTSALGVSFKVSVYDSSTSRWVVYGVQNVRRLNSTNTVKSSLSRRLSRYRWFAIESLDGNEYRYIPSSNRNDLYIHITD